jgi:hypothetical protein
VRVGAHVVLTFCNAYAPGAEEVEGAAKEVEGEGLASLLAEHRSAFQRLVASLAVVCKHSY